jgi:mono/diheme cytochrome c family protein
LYNQHCKSCHGTKGKGDGPKSSQLDTECGDFTKATFQAQTDGAIFYKTSEGRKDMPSYKKKIPEANDMWAVVNYVRTLK